MQDIPFLLPRTQAFLTAIYGSMFQYYEFRDTKDNHYELLEKACLQFNSSLYEGDDTAALLGLDWLGIEYNQETVPVVQLHEELKRITSETRLIHQYFDK